jgi:hypothetical protein
MLFLHDISEGEENREGNANYKFVKQHARG